MHEYEYNDLDTTYRSPSAEFNPSSRPVSYALRHSLCTTRATTGGSATVKQDGSGSFEEASGNGWECLSGAPTLVSVPADVGPAVGCLADPVRKGDTPAQIGRSRNRLPITVPE